MGCKRARELTGHTVRGETFGQPGFGCSGGCAEIGHQHPTAPSAPTLQYPAPGLAEGLRSGDETLQHTNGPRFELPATKILSPNEVDGCWFQPHGWASGLMPTDAGKLRRPGGRSPHSLLGQGSGGGKTPRMVLFSHCNPPVGLLQSAFSPQSRVCFVRRRSARGRSHWPAPTSQSIALRS